MTDHLRMAQEDILACDVPSTKSATAHALIAIAEELQELNKLLKPLSRPFWLIPPPKEVK